MGKIWYCRIVVEDLFFKDWTKVDGRSKQSEDPQAELGLWKTEEVEMETLIHKVSEILY